MDDAFSRDVWLAARSRPVIEQAKGFLMAYRPQSSEQAFAELVHVSQQHNVKVTALATTLVQIASGQAAAIPLLMRHIVATHWPAILIDATPCPPAPTESDDMRA